MKPCGNPDCKTSWGVHEGFTHGWGKLDFNGYWEHECKVCTELERKNEHPTTKDNPANKNRRQNP